jgi:hypothetical protein
MGNAWRLMRFGAPASSVTQPAGWARPFEKRCIKARTTIHAQYLGNL